MDQTNGIIQWFAKSKGKWLNIAKLGIMDHVPGWDALMCCRHKHLEERSCDYPCGDCTLRQIVFVSRSNIFLWQFMPNSELLSLCTWTHILLKSSIVSLGRGQRFCKMDVNFRKRELSACYFYKHISNYLLLRCTVKYLFLWTCDTCTYFLIFFFYFYFLSIAHVLCFKGFRVRSQ